MSDAETKRAIEILGGLSVIRRAAEPGRARAAPSEAVRARTLKGETLIERAVTRDIGHKKWTTLIRKGIPSKALENAAGHLGVSINELSQSLGLPTRTMHRRLQKKELLSPEETERSLRVARALARAQDLLGEKSGRDWLLSPCRGLGGDVPVTLLDTADGFGAVIDELGRLEYGVLS